MSLDRTVALIGEQAFSALQSAHVLVVGLGGVGGIAAEILARSGVGKLTVVDGDVFEPTNLNRQILCTVNDIGINKAEVAQDRLQIVNPDCEVRALQVFFNEQTLSEIFSCNYDYCIDAIDDVKNKILLISGCKAKGIPVVSAMGAGNRIDCDFAVTDIYKTKDDPLARKLRRELRAAGITALDVVCATTPPLVKSGTPLSIASPPLVMGAKLATHAIRRIANL